MTEHSRIVGLGPVLIDALFFLDRYPDEDTTLRASAVREQFGGPVPHRLAFHAAMGHDADLMAAVGDDAAGGRIREYLGIAGVSPLHVDVQPGAASGVASAWLAADTGSRTIAYTEGTLSPLAASPALEAFVDGAAMLHTDAREPAAAEYASKHARERGIPVSHDTGSPKPHSESLIRCADIVQVPILFARRVLGTEDSLDAARQVRRLGPHTVVVTDGTRGSAYSSADGEGSVSAFDVKAVMSIGAGDRFGGALSHALLAGVPIRDAVVFASAAAAMRVASADGALPTEQEVWDFAAATPPLEGKG